MPDPWLFVHIPPAGVPGAIADRNSTIALPIGGWLLNGRSALHTGLATIARIFASIMAVKDGLCSFEEEVYVAPP